MNHPVLMTTTEPTDNQLTILMHEVALEAKQKALITQQQLAEKVKQLIMAAKEKQ